MSKLLTDQARVLPVLVVAVVIAVGATLVIVLSGGSTGASGSASASSTAVVGGKGQMVTVNISMFAYKPTTLTVAPGTAVAFTNRDTTEHTATEDIGPVFDTGAIQHGQTKMVTFAKPGTYRYKCSFHPFMTGTVIVK
ncbi:MAG TPA: plastocyanin/azurin family copper-binding protein [Solirubrobacteraceae bacterium]|jgi:plastocyanin|nr:plastocyanin/azurin family copper-binding protein [Solirubrobacteraceae bacterium]